VGLNRFIRTGGFQRLLERRWLLVPLAAAIGLVSGVLLWATLQRDYWDYWLNPKLKAADPGLYIYPQLRYTLFDIVLLAWCLDGLIACGLSLWSVISSRSIAGRTYRSILIYFLLFAVLILGGSLMLFVRSRGF
jgi:hypothetical protein